VPCTAREIAREAISKLLKINLEAIWLVEERLLNYWQKVIGNNLFDNKFLLGGMPFMRVDG
jgi:hypothetical protein